MVPPKGATSKEHQKTLLHHIDYGMVPVSLVSVCGRKQTAMAWFVSWGGRSFSLVEISVVGHQKVSFHER
jgi:hypothetical protein